MDLLKIVLVNVALEDQKCAGLFPQRQLIGEAAGFVFPHEVGLWGGGARGGKGGGARRGWGR